VTTSQEEAQALAAPGSPADPRVYSSATVRFAGDGEGRVAAVHLAEAEPADRSPRPGTEHALDAELVLLALGFSGPDPSGPLAAQLGLATDPSGALARDETFATSVDGVFVAGDAGRGQSLIVWAIAEGRSVAAAVDRYLTGDTTLHAPITAKDRPLAA
jgi:glutamate synthase (NADPH/NADH) small chain